MKKHLKQKVDGFSSEKPSKRESSGSVTDDLTNGRTMRNKHLRSSVSARTQTNSNSDANRPRRKRPKVARIDKSITACRREAAKVYKQVRHGAISLEEGRTCMKMIDSMVDIIIKDDGDPQIIAAMIKLEEARAAAGITQALQLPAYQEALARSKDQH